MNVRQSYKNAARRIRAESVPANSGAAWRIICEEFGINPENGTPWGTPALTVQSLLQRNSYPSSSLHHSLAHRLLNFPSLIRNYERARRCANLSACMRHKGKVKTLAGGYVALPDDDNETLQNEWRALGRAYP